jgi:hypothetical protein
MEYEYRLHRRVLAQITRWGLSDFLLVELYLALDEVLSANPVGNLRRDPDGGPGAIFSCWSIDPDSPRFQHIFHFRVFYDEDEKHLHIVRGSYWRNFRG